MMFRVRTIVIGVIIVSFACAFSSRASATPLSLSTTGVVGTLDGKIGNSNPTTELDIAQKILDFVGLGVISPATPTQKYKTSTVFDYAATLSVPSQSSKGAFVVPDGFRFALAKYDGPNGGYVLYFLPTSVPTFMPAFAGNTLPRFPADFWTTDPNKWGISHYTTFNAVLPTPPTVPDGGTTMALFGMALCGVGIFLRRRPRP